MKTKRMEVAWYECLTSSWTMAWHVVSYHIVNSVIWNVGKFLQIRKSIFLDPAHNSSTWTLQTYARSYTRKNLCHAIPLGPLLERRKRAYQVVSFQLFTSQNVIRIAAKCNTSAKCNKLLNAKCNNLSTQIVKTFLTHNVTTQNVIISE